MGIKEKTAPMIKEGDQKATIRRRSWEVPIKSYRKEKVKKGGGGGGPRDNRERSKMAKRKLEQIANTRV